MKHFKSKLFAKKFKCTSLKQIPLFEAILHHYNAGNTQVTSLNQIRNIKKC